MVADSISSDVAAPERVPLNDFISLVPPVGWEMGVRVTRSPHRTGLPPVITFIPYEDAEIALRGWGIDWLEGQPELQAFHELLAEPGEASLELIARLFPALVRIPIWFLTHAEVIHHAGLGRVLVIDYDRSDTWEKGRIVYAKSPSSEFDVQVISYEGIDPAFGAYVIDALVAIESLERTVEENEIMDFLDDLAK